MKAFSTSISIILLLLSGCNLLLDGDNSPARQEARIVFGESIEGIRIGDDSSRVVQALGPPPSQAFGDFDGWIYVYDEGELALTEIPIAKNEGVLAVRVYPPYSGTTADGVGIGISREVALGKLGQPTRTREIAKGILDVYVFEDASIAVEYEDQSIYSIRMSPR